MPATRPARRRRRGVASIGHGHVAAPRPWLAAAMLLCAACAADVDRRAMIHAIERRAPARPLGGLAAVVEATYSVEAPRPDDDLSQIDGWAGDYRRRVATALLDAGLTVVRSAEESRGPVVHVQADFVEIGGEPPRTVRVGVEVRHGSTTLAQDSFTTATRWRCPANTDDCLELEEQNRVNQIVNLVLEASGLYELAAGAAAAAGAVAAAAPTPSAPPADAVQRPPAALRTPGKLVVLPLRARKGVDRDAAELLTGMLLSQLQGVPGLQTIASSDMEAILGAESQKDLLGCDTVTCATELGGALGADLVLYGDLGVLGRSYALNLSVLRMKDAAVGARLSRTSQADDDGLIQTLDGAVAELVDQLNR